MEHTGGRGRNRRGQPGNRVSDQGYAISVFERLVRCGNPRCHKCQKGPSHGPYIYERFRDAAGKTHTRYKGRARNNDKEHD
ncbi:MAG: DUF6788 family protein [Syntrophomonas sp.]